MSTINEKALMIDNQNFSKKLTMYFRKIGLEMEEYVLLDACIKFQHQNPDQNFISKITGFEKKKIERIILNLVNYGLITQLQDGTIDFTELHKKLNQIEFKLLPLKNKIMVSKSSHQHGDEAHMGMVELVAPSKKNGIYVKNFSSSREGHIWRLDDMKQLAKEILEFTALYTQEQIDQYNKDVDRYNKDVERQNEIEREINAKKAKEREEELRKRDAPKSGCILLCRSSSSGLYNLKFSISVSIDHRVSQIKEEYGDELEIIHTLETYDTYKLLNKFIKKQFSNRSTEGGWYELSEEDVEFFKNEKYPPQAMEWLNGKSEE
ncbi:hypothetical protein [Cytobacillus sp. IB215665]|uniref:hypothetical protein n=1 Tax=Cytobacillus sp. IB215665 TaxID=3097357 RepID=UPI002A0CA003|nr:hypothetical protein [Cytobacillus sp. IB215665]MDX8367812.1 hypothetical protein [Cytobacillus sp. IB215665]